MHDLSEPVDPRSNLIESLLIRQDEVIRELDELDKRLIETIESVRVKKKDEQLEAESATSSEKVSETRAA